MLSDRCPVLSCPVLCVTFVYCGQTVGWIKMKLDMEAGLGPGRIILDGDPALPKRGDSPQFSVHVYCDQPAGWIKMPLGTEVGLGPSDIVLDGDPALPYKGYRPQFWSMSVVAQRLGGSRFKMPLGTEVGFGPGHFVLDGNPAPPPKRGTTPPSRVFGPCLLWPNGWMDQDATWYGGRLRPRRHCVRWRPSSPSKKGHSPHFWAHIYCGETVAHLNYC